MKKILSLFLIISMLFITLCSCDGAGGSGTGEGGGEVELPDYGTSVGDRCYPYSLDLVLGEGRVSIEDYMGKIVVLNFWGTWCGPCKTELPGFDNVASEYNGEVVVLAVHSYSGIENAPEYIETYYPDSEIVFAKDTPLSESNPDLGDKYYMLVGGTGYYPTTLILDKNGVIKYTSYGLISEELLISEIEKLR